MIFGIDVPRRCLGRAGVTLAVALLTVSGCGGKDSKAVLPTSTPLSAPSATPATAEDRITASYSQYWTVVAQADKAPAESRRQLLASYVAEPLVSEMLRNIEQLHARNQTSWGYVVVHVQRVRVNGDSATVEDCQDSSNAGMMNSKDNKKISQGVSNDRLRATLMRGTDGQWRISRMSAIGRC